MNTIALFATALVAFAVTSALGFWMIPFLRKLKFGQTIIDVGPTWHKNKQGTPTMGGLMFAVGILAAVAAGFIIISGNGVFNLSQGETPVSQIPFFSAIFLALGYGIIGFVDDYIKVVKKRNLGLTGKEKLAGQIVLAFIYLFISNRFFGGTTYVAIPFLGLVNFGFFYYIFAALVIVGFTNAVNLTDGVDGLCSSVTFFVGMALFVVSMLLTRYDMAVVSLALAGGCLGFLVWNFNPAKIFMGDIGAFFLGGLVVGIVFGLNLPYLIFFAGIIYLIEAFSDILQVISFKSTGKRLFKMAPIHHHFEMSGYSETQIVFFFSLITIIGGVIAVLSVNFL